MVIWRFLLNCYMFGSLNWNIIVVCLQTQSWLCMAIHRKPWRTPVGGYSLQNFLPTGWADCCYFGVTLTMKFKMQNHLFPMKYTYNCSLECLDPADHGHFHVKVLRLRSNLLLWITLSCHHRRSEISLTLWFCSHVSKRHDLLLRTSTCGIFPSYRSTKYIHCFKYKQMYCIQSEQILLINVFLRLHG